MWDQNLKQLIMSGNLDYDAFRKLLENEKQPNFNATEMIANKQWTPLAWLVSALEKNRTDKNLYAIIIAIINHPQFKWNGFTEQALFEALQAGDNQLAWEFLSLKIPKNYKFIHIHQGETLLAIAIDKCKPYIVDKMMDFDVDVSNPRDGSRSNSPFMIALLKKKLLAVQCMIKHSKFPFNNSIKDSIMSRKWNADRESIEQLYFIQCNLAKISLEFYLEFDSRTVNDLNEIMNQECDVTRNVTAEENSSIFHRAIQKNSSDLIQAMLKHANFNFNASSDESIQHGTLENITSYHTMKKACLNKELKKLLEQASPDKNVFSRLQKIAYSHDRSLNPVVEIDGESNSLFVWAAKKNNQILLEMMRRDERLNLDKDSSFALCYALTNKNESLISTLKHMKPDTEDVYRIAAMNGKSPLYYVFDQARIDVLDKMIEYGVDLFSDDPSFENMTPIHWLIENKKLEIMGAILLNRSFKLTRSAIENINSTPPSIRQTFVAQYLKMLGENGRADIEQFGLLLEIDCPFNYNEIIYISRGYSTYLAAILECSNMSGDNYHKIAESIIDDKRFKWSKNTVLALCRAVKCGYEALAIKLLNKKPRDLSVTFDEHTINNTSAMYFALQNKMSAVVTLMRDHGYDVSLKKDTLNSKCALEIDVLSMTDMLDRCASREEMRNPMLLKRLENRIPQEIFNEIRPILEDPDYLSSAETVKKLEASHPIIRQFYLKRKCELDVEIMVKSYINPPPNKNGLGDYVYARSCAQHFLEKHPYITRDYLDSLMPNILKVEMKNYILKKVENELWLREAGGFGYMTKQAYACLRFFWEARYRKYNYTALKNNTVLLYELVTGENCYAVDVRIDNKLSILDNVILDGNVKMLNTILMQETFIFTSDTNKLIEYISDKSDPIVVEYHRHRLKMIDKKFGVYFNEPYSFWADSNEFDPNCGASHVDEIQHNGQTLLHSFCSKKSWLNAERLVNMGANVNFVFNEKTPLMLAIYALNFKIAKIMINSPHFKYTAKTFPAFALLTSMTQYANKELADLLRGKMGTSKKTYLGVLSDPIETQKIIPETPPIETQNRILETPPIETQNRILETPPIETQNRILETPPIETQNRILEAPLTFSTQLKIFRKNAKTSIQNMISRSNVRVVGMVDLGDPTDSKSDAKNRPE